MQTGDRARRVTTIDASAIVSMLIDPESRGERVADAIRGAQLVAPELIRIEVTNVLRRRRGAGLITPEGAAEAFAILQRIPMSLWPFEAIAERAWQLGDNLSTYDACYVALAEHTASPLVTCDARIARAPGVACKVVVID